MKLDERLALCAEIVRPGARVVDVGTDHAYLPISLAKNGLISSAIASDARKGPLANAASNISKHRVGHIVKTRLSDGLCEILPTEIDDIIIAGLGGETIAKILAEAPWTKNSSKCLVLQPMTAAEDLRRFLWREKFALEKEIAVICKGKVYSAMLARFLGDVPVVSRKYPYVGALEGASAATKLYIDQVVKDLRNRRTGALKNGDFAFEKELSETINELSDGGKFCEDL